MTETNQFSTPYDIEKIREIIPHRYPFLLVDRVMEINEQEGIIRGYKNVSANEPFFVGHFPGHSVMPGVLILEAMAQLGAVYILGRPECQGRIAYFMTIDEARFRKPVVPGDRLDMTLTLIKIKKTFGKMSGVATVDGNVVAEGTMSFALAPTQ